MSTPSPAVPTEPTIDTAPSSELEKFLDKHFRTICYIVIGIVVAGSVYAYVRFQAQQEATQAAMEATSAKTVEDCDVVIQKHKGSTAAGNALLNKARLLWDQNKKDPAVAALREFTSTYKNHPFYVQGMISLGSRLESMGGDHIKEAKGLFEQIVREHKDSSLAGLAQMRLGDMAWAQGKADEAKKIYEELPRNFPGQFFDENQKRLDWIAAALPTSEVSPPKIPEALKVPDPSASGVKEPPPPLDSVPGLDLKPMAIRPSRPSRSQPEFKIDPTPGSLPQIKIDPQQPSATSAPVELKLPEPPKITIPAPSVSIPAQPTPTPAPVPESPSATKPVEAPASAPAATPPAATPAPAPTNPPPAAQP